MTSVLNPMRPPPGLPRPYRFPPFTRRRLANGLNLWTVHVAGSNLVNVHLLVDAGAAAEEEEAGGIAALTAQLLVTGTRRLDASAYAEATERLGIEVSSESSWDSARGAFQSLPQHLDAGLALLAEMIREPRFDAGEFERLKAERLADILQARAEPGRLADEMFLLHAYAADTPYRRLSAGSPETVQTLSREDVVAFHDALEAALWSEVDRVTADGPSEDELGRVRNLHAAGVEGSMERISERADRLSMYACLFDQPERINTEVSRYAAVEAGQVREAMAATLRTDNRVVLTYLPAESPESGEVPG